MRVLGIDPGLRITGYGCVEATPEASGRATAPAFAPRGPGTTLVEAGVFRLSARRPVADRLVELEADLAEALERLRPGLVAVEKVFAHYRHPATAAVMGHARGVVLLVTRRSGTPLVELGATEVKKSLTGNGHAGKGQMQGAVAAQLGLASRPEPADVADAIAIALCALRRSAAAAALPADGRARRAGVRA